MGPGGNVMSDAASFGTLHMGEMLVTGVEEEPTGTLPDRFALGQNYPNPFNPTTSIEYGVSATAQVAVHVYNVLGQRAATLIDAVRTAGTYRATWDASGLPSGIYLYQLVVDGAVIETKKMMLVK